MLRLSGVRAPHALPRFWPPDVLVSPASLVALKTPGVTAIIADFHCYIMEIDKQNIVKSQNIKKKKIKIWPKALQSASLNRHSKSQCPHFERWDIPPAVDESKLQILPQSSRSSHPCCRPQPGVRLSQHSAVKMLLQPFQPKQLWWSSQEERGRNATGSRFLSC